MPKTSPIYDIAVIKDYIRQIGHASTSAELGEVMAEMQDKGILNTRLVNELILKLSQYPHCFKIACAYYRIV